MAQQLALTRQQLTIPNPSGGEPTVKTQQLTEYVVFEHLDPPGRELFMRDRVPIYGPRFLLSKQEIQEMDIRQGRVNAELARLSQQ
jgi:hypothetical protein